jgi:predicted lipid carrier protein YhbT
MALETKDATGAFFDDLARRGHEPLLAKTDGTIRFDLADGDRNEHWLVEVRRGDVAVSRGTARADVVVGADRQLFEQVLEGKTSAVAAFLRGAIVAEGDVGLLVTFQRLFARSGMSLPAGATAAPRARGRNEGRPA